MSESILTKKAIAGSLKSLCKEKPFDKITVSDITNLCGINRQTFYYHFQDKYELLSWIYYNEAFVPIMNGISFENWDQKLEELFSLMNEEKYFYVNTIKYSDSYFQEYLTKLAEIVFEEAIDKLDTEKSLIEDERVLFAKFYAYGICGTVSSWVLSGMKITPKGLASYMKRLAISSEKAGYILSTIAE